MAQGNDLQSEIKGLFDNLADSEGAVNKDAVSKLRNAVIKLGDLLSATLDETKGRKETIKELNAKISELGGEIEGLAGEKERADNLESELASYKAKIEAFNARTISEAKTVISEVGLAENEKLIKFFPDSVKSPDTMTVEEAESVISKVNEYRALGMFEPPQVDPSRPRPQATKPVETGFSGIYKKGK